MYEWLLFGEYIQTKLYPEQEYQNEYIGSIYVYMHMLVGHRLVAGSYKSSHYEYHR